MSFATLVLLIAAGFSNTPGFEYTERGEKILVDLLWASKNFDIPADILLSQYWQESKHKYWATSPVRSDGFYDVGFSQMNTKYIAYYRDLCERKLNRPLSEEEVQEVNILLGSFVLHQNISEFGDARRGLMAYVGGAQPVRDRAPVPAAVIYADQILNRTRSLSGMEEVLSSFFAAVFELDGTPITLKEAKALLWGLPTLKQRNITKENFLRIFTK